MTQTPVTDEPVEVPPAPSPGLRDAFHEYVARVRGGGDVGPLPAILGPGGAARSPSPSSGRTRSPTALRQPADPERPGHRDRDGPGLRPAARRDRLSAGYTAGVAGATLGVVATRHDYPWWIGFSSAWPRGRDRARDRRPGGAGRHPGRGGPRAGINVPRIRLLCLSSARRSQPSPAFCSRAGSTR